jgi:hypothetical protein
MMALSMVQHGCERRPRVPEARITQLQAEGLRLAHAMRQYATDTGQHAMHFRDLVPKYLLETPAQGIARGGWEVWQPLVRRETDEIGLLYQLYDVDGKACNLVYKERSGWSQVEYRSKS